MKMIFSQVRFMEPLALKHKSILGLVLVLVFSAVGCEKSKPSATPAAPDQTNQAAAETAPASVQPSAAAAPEAAPAQPASQPDLHALDHALMRWMMANRRPPKDFADFAATAGVTIPPPPPGKKYIIAKNMHIQLVDAVNAN